MMSDKLRAAAKAAYRAMISAELSDGSRREWEAAVDGLKDALAEQTVKESLTVAEPVAWKHPDKNMVFWEDTKEVDEYHGFKSTIPLYPAPPSAQPAQERMHPEVKKMYEDYFDKCFRESSAQQRPWVGLTDDEVNLIYAEPQTHVGQYARAIEAKLREKNT